jgi:ribosomal protein L11 methyltransferase
LKNIGAFLLQESLFAGMTLDLSRITTMPWLQLKVISPRKYVKSLESSLLACGAAAVTLQDNADQPIFEPGLGETPLWDQVQISGLFDAEINTAQTITLAEKRFGNPLPEYTWDCWKIKIGNANG